MQNRIREKILNFKNAKTFHSWAWSIVKPEKDTVLFDSDGQFSPKKYSKFIKEIIVELVNKDNEFQKDIYAFFREDTEETSNSLSETKFFSNTRDRYLYLRNETEISVNGIQTKSSGEKWIADFFFEHGIKSYYERHLTWGAPGEKAYHPDFKFSYNNKDYVLEHWGIDEFDPKRDVPKHWNKTWHEYHQDMLRKRDFFKAPDHKYKLIETSISDINYSLPLKERRVDFENSLTKILSYEGIHCEKLSEEELIKKAWEKNIFNRLEQITGDFVGWMQKLELTEDELRSRLKQSFYSDKQKKFCDIGLKIYKSYIEKLKQQEKIDFNLLISLATQKIRTKEFDISNLKYILIDEFQDFSKLFQNLIDTIMVVNPQLKLFCVGDPWQLINGWAGSDPELFYTFSDIANNKTISTCYRSTEEIINNANKFAANYPTFKGEMSHPNNTNTAKGVVNKIIIDDIEICNDNIDNITDNEFKKYFRKESNKENKEFMPDDQYINARYLKFCTQIIQDNPYSSFLFLYRNKKMHGIDIQQVFRQYLEKTLKEKNLKYKELRFRTIHAAKGEGADVVTIFNVTEKVLPSIHPSNQLFEVFGLTPNKVLDEEKRLFYVAITRAKKNLYLISEEGKTSTFFNISKGREIDEKVLFIPRGEKN